MKILCRQLFPFQPKGHWNQTDKNIIGIGWVVIVWISLGVKGKIKSEFRFIPKYVSLIDWPKEFLLTKNWPTCRVYNLHVIQEILSVLMCW